MNEETGKIRLWDEVMKDHNENLDKWKMFRVGEIINIKGIDMELVRVKALRGELVFRKAQ